MLDINDFAAVGPREDSGGRTIMAQMVQSFTKDDHIQKPRPLDDLFCGVGQLVFAWGMLEAQLEQKITDLRRAAGDVRSATARTKPTMARMLAELRAIISMRCRRDNVQLDEIAEIERTIQQIDKFRMLVIQGFQIAGDATGKNERPFLCRDAKNNIIGISLEELDREISRLDACRERLLAL